jgi:hypothetical protein
MIEDAGPARIARRDPSFARLVPKRAPVHAEIGGDTAGRFAVA